MKPIVLGALVLVTCVVFATELLAQASQTVNPVPITPPTINTTTLTCQVNCDTQAMICHQPAACLQTALLKARSRDDEKLPRGFTVDVRPIIPCWQRWLWRRSARPRPVD
jgi:hypothetical protein